MGIDETMYKLCLLILILNVSWGVVNFDEAHSMLVSEIGHYW